MITASNECWAGVALALIALGTLISMAALVCSALSLTKGHNARNTTKRARIHGRAAAK